MVIIGAKGFARELLQVLVSARYNFDEQNLYFFDNVNTEIPDYLFDKYRVLKTFDDVRSVFKNSSNEFCLGLGTPKLRHNLAIVFEDLDGELQTIISEGAEIGTFGTNIGQGTTIIGNAVITNDVKIGRGVLIYMNTSITHDVTLGDFVQISPGVSILGRSSIGNFTMIGAGAIILPDIIIGDNCIVGAGTIVTKNVPNNSLVVGVPGKIIKKLA